MAQRLQVDTDGMTSGAAASDAIASGLSPHFDEVSGPQPSHCGVSAMNDAIAAVRVQQARRVRSQSEAMHAGATLYEDTDSEAAQTLAGSV